MKNVKLFLILFILSVLQSCSSSDDSTPKSPETPVDPFVNLVITTKAATYNSVNSVLLTGGTLSATLDNSNYNYNVGVCYSENPNPTINGNSYNANSSGLNGNTFESTIYGITLGQTYYLRSFVQNFSTGEVKYGNEISYVQNLELTTSIVKNISVTGFSVDITVGNSLATNAERGVCYSTSQNPTVTNQKYQDATNGSGGFTLNIDGGTLSPFYYVSPNTTYYLRSYVQYNGQYYYGNQVSFKTCGYTDGSGGYVFYDKGETTNGWRYLEAAPSKLETSSFSYFRWVSTSCTANTFLNGIQNTIGTGLENSSIIKTFCNYNSVGATMCIGTSLNGQTNWFLPSIDEAKELYKLKHTNLVTFDNVDLLSSSQSSNSLCFAINIINGDIFTSSKTNSFQAWQVRRF